ncbi:uncharacterized protein LOC100183151 [Ciona intestinalis]
MNITRFMLAGCIAIFSIITAVPAVKSDGGAPCDENGLCKYGGKCGPTNTCVCKFSCSVEKWDIDIHCGINKPGIRRKYYLNLCQLQAHACELQMDIPIKKLGYKKPTKKRCKAKSEESYKLCSRAEDFMGRCGGGISSTTYTSAGICLEEKLSGEKRCECPNDKTGPDCRVKSLAVRSVSWEEHEEIGGDEGDKEYTKSRLPQILVFGLVSAALLVVFSLLLIKRFVMKRGNRNEILPPASPTSKETCVELPDNSTSTQRNIKPMNIVVSVCPDKDSQHRCRDITSQVFRPNPRRERLAALSSPTAGVKSHTLVKSASQEIATFQTPHLVRAATT